MLKNIKKEKSQVVLTCSILASEVRETFEELKEQALMEVEVKGFRKGKAPRQVAEKHLNHDALAQKLFNRLVPKKYAEVIKTEGLKPISHPHVEVVEYDPDFKKDLVIKITVAERPQIEVGDFEKELKSLKPKTIYGPGGKPVGKEQSEITSKQVLEKLLEISNVEVPEMLVEDETSRMLSSLVNQTQSLGLSVEEYARSTGKTPAQLREQYRLEAEKSLKLEFILDEIANRMNIKVEESQINASIQAAPDPQARQSLATSDGKVYIKSVLRKRKTIEQLLELAEGREK